jgi:multidrug resistance efflux pump
MMSSIEQDVRAPAARETLRRPAAPGAPARRPRLLPYLITIATVALASFLTWQGWRLYMGSPWTRDGAVRAYVVSIAAQVAGQIVSLPIRDNQFVHKGELLMLIDPTDYAIAVRRAQAAVDQAKSVADNAEAEWIRRKELTDIAVTAEERQTYAARALSAEAAHQLALTNLATARLDFQRTRVLAPVNGYVTNLLATAGD